MARDIIAPHLAEGISQALFEVFHNQLKTDRVISLVLKERKKWGSRDRRIFAQSVYECSRWWKRLWYCAGFEGDGFDPQAVTIEKATYIWKLWLKTSRPDFYRDPENAKPQEWQRWQNPPELDIRESLSGWLNRTGMEELGSFWETIITSLNVPAEAYLRANTLRTSRDQLVRDLAALDIGAVQIKGEEEAVCLNERKNVFITDLFKKGLFEMQDIGSQRISKYLDPQPGMRVVDACAGGGGKSLHLAALMKNRGKIIALDKNDWRLAPLRDRASRAGADIIESRVIVSQKTVKRIFDSADRLLLDVPCTGSGTIRRSPDVKWSLAETQFRELLATQQEILQKYSPIVKTGGIMVYSTCSVFPSENFMQIEKFLGSEAGKNWELMEHRIIIPATGNVKNKSEWDDFFYRMAKGLPLPEVIFLNSDGFYMAKLKKV